ncbi:metallophosphoesterase [Erwinia oleae]|uniref:metallophosphoesterase n=1 Tax=Erwinia oleae TaxID=796334 RepID=UPI0005526286|nr:metallophosphoesterase [Erwinia oleae]
MLYHYLDGKNWRHIYLVGDLHGCKSMLDSQLLTCRFDPQQDLLVAVGDLIDRGPDSMGCLSLLQAPWFRSVRGNHEEMALNAIHHGAHQQWIRNGGDWFYQLQGAQMIEAKHALSLCNQLPLILHILLDGRVVVVAHADYPAAHYSWGAEVDPYEVVWSRARIERVQNGRGGKIAGADDFYFGHTPLSSPLHAFNLHYIDTGAVFGNTLTLVQIQ